MQMARDMCFELLGRIGERISFIAEGGSDVFDGENVKEMIKQIDLVYSYFDESIFAEFDHLAKSVHYYRNKNAVRNLKEYGVGADIADEYITFLRNEIVTKFYTHWTDIRAIVPTSIWAMPMFLLTKMSEMIRATIKMINILNEACFWVPFLVPAMDEAMNLDISTVPPRNFIDTEIATLLKGTNRGLTFYESQTIAISLDDLKVDIAIKYFHHTRKVWEERRLREVFEMAFKATKFTNTMEAYNVAEPTYANDPEPSAELETRQESMKSETASLASTSRAASIRSNLTFNIKLGGDTKKVVVPVQVHIDPIRDAEEALLYHRNFQSEWNEFAAYMLQFQAFMQPK